MYEWVPAGLPVMLGGNPVMDWHPIEGGAVLSVKFEVGVSLLLAPAGADKRGPKTPFL